MRLDKPSAAVVLEMAEAVETPEAEVEGRLDWQEGYLRSRCAPPVGEWTKARELSKVP